MVGAFLQKTENLRSELSFLVDLMRFNATVYTFWPLPPFMSKTFLKMYWLNDWMRIIRTQRGF